jgi:hypothetical protein
MPGHAALEPWQTSTLGSLETFLIIGERTLLRFIAGFASAFALLSSATTLAQSPPADSRPPLHRPRNRTITADGTLGSAVRIARTPCAR